MNEIMFGNYLFMCASVTKQLMYDYTAEKDDTEAERMLKYLGCGVVGAYLDYKDIDPAVMAEAFRKQRQKRKERRVKRASYKKTDGADVQCQSGDSRQKAKRNERDSDVFRINHFVRRKGLD